MAIPVFFLTEQSRGLAVMNGESAAQQDVTDRANRRVANRQPLENQSYCV